MPELIWLYLTALLYYRTSASCVALAEALQGVSHDRLTRMLQADWSGHTLLESACRLLCVWERGYLLLDDTVIAKPVATAIESLAWVFSSRERRRVYGVSLVLLVWTDGTLRMPLGVRLWRKGGPSKSELALEWLSYARHRRHCRPAYVICDAWYPSKALLKRIRDYGWSVVCRLKKNRRFNGHPLRHHRRHPYWAEGGWLNGGLKVLVVRYGKKYYATNRLTLPAAEVRRRYGVRAQLEEVIRVCKDQLALSGCQARSERAPLHHITCGLVAFCVLERERHERQLSIYTLRRQLSCRGRSLATSPGAADESCVTSEHGDHKPASHVPKIGSRRVRMQVMLPAIVQRRPTKLASGK
jgi:Transposase DDE domain